MYIHTFVKFSLFIVLSDFMHLVQQQLSHKTNVHFALDGDVKEQSKVLVSQRTISPLPISNATRYKSDSNPNLLMTTVAPIPTIHKSQSLIGHHIITVNMFNKEMLKDIFNIAEIFRHAIRKERSLDQILRVMKNSNGKNGCIIRN